jgi:aspartate aminotransferase-like enzyme
MKLFIPGPTDVREDVLRAMAKPPISHRGEEVAALCRTVTERAQKIMRTSHPVILSTSSATGLMEAAVRNAVEKRVLSLVCGAFSDRWNKIAGTNGIDSDRLEVPWGEAIDPAALEDRLRSGSYDAVTLVHNETSTAVANDLETISAVMKKFPDIAFMVDTVSSLGGMPVEVDRMGIDLCLASVQKCLALPPGFSLCSLSPKILERSRRAKNKGWYFDLARRADKAESGQAPVTPSISHMFAMERQFQVILEEGLESRWERHRKMAGRTRAWAKEKFALFADEMICSDTVTCIRNTRGIDLGQVLAEMKRRGYHLGNGYGKLKGQAFRIAHMGERRLDEMDQMLAELDDVLAGGGA